LIIEFGQGVDMHGADQNNAVQKATEDAVHHCCMAGIAEIFEITDRKNEAYIKADIYAPHPEKVDPDIVVNYLNKWNVEAEVHHGGANPEGIALDGKEKTEITIAIVVLTVYVDVWDKRNSLDVDEEWRQQLADAKNERNNRKTQYDQND
jgi:uncharacterized protein (TIGR02058 family)